MNNQLNILLLDCAPFTGGAQKSFWSLVSKLPERGCSPLLIAADGLAEQTRDAVFPCRTISARHWPASLKGLWQYWQDSHAFAPLFDEAVANFNPCLVHANCIRSALLLPADYHLPILLHDRDIRFPFFFVRLVANRFPNLHVVAISPLVAEKWRDLLPDGRLHIVPNGFDLQAIANTQPAAKNDSASLRLLQVADFSPWKRHDRFLSLLAQLKPQIPGLKAVIKGRIRDPQGEQLLNNLKRTASTLGLNDILSFNTADESALPEIGAADVVVSCSDSEPFGRVIIEALALGKPVISCIGGGLDSFLSDCPTFMAVPPEKLQDAVLQWLPAEKRQAAIPIAKKTAEAFSIERHVADIVDIYKKIAP